MLTDKQRAQTARRQQRFRQRQKQARKREQEDKGLLPAIPSIPGTARWRAALQSAQALVQTVVEEMSEYYDDRSEIWLESEAAELFQERQQEMEEALSQLESVTL
jgi:hypothetical protein